MKVNNRKAKFNYHIHDTFEAGISLNGQEARAVRGGKVNLTNSFAKVIGDEIYLVNATINVADRIKFSPTRTRKLLLHRRQINSINAEIKAKKLTLIPLSIYTKGRLIKAKLALSKPKKQYEKRETIRRREAEREIEKELKGA